MPGRNHADARFFPQGSNDPIDLNSGDSEDDLDPFPNKRLYEGLTTTDSHTDTVSDVEQCQSLNTIAAMCLFIVVRTTVPIGPLRLRRIHIDFELF